MPESAPRKSGAEFRSPKTLEAIECYQGLRFLRKAEQPMFRTNPVETLRESTRPGRSTAPDSWFIPRRPDPAYRIHYRYSWWGNQRRICASVYQVTWYGDRLLLSTYRTTAKSAYRAAHRAIRAFERYGNVNYCHAPNRVRMPCPLDDNER